ncbi:TNF receptor-associated factor 6-like [Diadema antillarum]|uniref:TNF receptor-associated factor 6-like n=1 Tax=Diadema antillarum TaxID=105358 RepID=UPI003A86C340
MSTAPWSARVVTAGLPSSNGASAAATGPATGGSGLRGGAAGAVDSMGQSGYEARFKTPLDQKYLCPVCLAALRDPMQTKCGHRFCRACLTRASGSGTTAKCPLDKLWFDVRSEVFEDVAMKREVLSLTVLCSNVDHGCEWEGELRVMESHLSECPHAMILCTNGCLAHHKRMDTEEHHRDCPSRLVECSYCQQQVTFKCLNQHQVLLCPRYILDCPLCGKTGFVREELPKHTDHKDGDCPKAVVPCLFAEMGCQIQVGRSDLQHHCQESLGCHLELLLTNHVTQVERMREQNSVMQELRETCSRLMCQKTETDSKIATLTEEVDLLREELALSRSINYTGQLLWKVQISSRDFTTPLLSPPFFTAPCGYKLRLCLELRGHVTRSDSYTSLFVMLCKGEHDNSLFFPFSAVCALTLFDQSEGSNHLTTNITCQKMPRPQEEQSQMQSRGRLKFMKTDTLVNGRFCKGGTLYFQARVTTQPMLPSIGRQD